MQEHLTGRGPIFRHHAVKYSSCWGRCREVLPRLEGGAAHRADKDPEYRVSMATAPCAMSLDDSEAAAAALFRLHAIFKETPKSCSRRRTSSRNSRRVHCKSWRRELRFRNRRKG